VNLNYLQAVKPAGLWPRGAVSSASSSHKNDCSFFRPWINTVLIAAILFMIFPICRAQSLPTEQAAVAQNFVNMSGVVTHFNYTNTVYGTNFPQLFQALQNLGVHHIRDG
jgi:hypothetical protein